MDFSAVTTKQCILAYLSISDETDRQQDVCRHTALFSTDPSPWQPHSCSLNHCHVEMKYSGRTYCTSPQYRLPDNRQQTQ